MQKYKDKNDMKIRHNSMSSMEKARKNFGFDYHISKIISKNINIDNDRDKLQQPRIYRSLVSFTRRNL